MRKLPKQQVFWLRSEYLQYAKQVHECSWRYTLLYEPSALSLWRLKKEVKVFFYPELFEFQKSIAFWKVPSPRPFFFVVTVTYIEDELIYIIYKNSVRNSQRTQWADIRKTSHLMLYLKKKIFTAGIVWHTKAKFVDDLNKFANVTGSVHKITTGL
jgi:hypothetical protein